jgi:hypothetical protein
MVSAMLFRAALDPEHNAATFLAITPRVALYTLDIRRVYPRPARPPTLAVRPVLATLFFFSFCERARRTGIRRGNFSRIAVLGARNPCQKKAKLFASSSGSDVCEHP